MEPLDWIIVTENGSTPTLTPAMPSLPPGQERIERHLQQLYGPDWRLHLEPDRVEPADLGCPTCRGTGWLVKRSGPEWEPSHPEFGKARPCPDCTAHTLDRARIDRIFGAAMIPALLEPLTFTSFQALAGADQMARAVMETWAGDETLGSIYLWGRVGRGKSALAKAALVARMERTRAAGLFCVTPDLLGRIRDTYSRQEGAPTEAEVIESVMRVGVLVLDDIGTDKPSDWVVQTLYRILNERYLQRRPTIFTSNFDLNRLGTMLGSRISWRIAQMCEPNVIEVAGENLRERAA